MDHQEKKVTLCVYLCSTTSELRDQGFWALSIESNDLESSLHNFLTRAESQFLTQMESGIAVPDHQPIPDAGIFKLSTKTTIKQLVLDASRVLLIRHSNFEMAQIVEGMGNFKKNTGPTLLDVIYQYTIPNQYK